MRTLVCAGLLSIGIAAAGLCPVSFAEEVSPSQEPVAVSSAPAAGQDTRTNIQKLSDPAPFVRRNAAIFLGSEKKKENVPELLKLLNDPEPEVRRAAVGALADTGDRRATLPLAAAFKGEQEITVKMDIIIALGDLKDPSPVTMLTALLKDPYPVFRSEALRSLGKIRAPETYKTLVAMLNDEAEGVRVIAADVAGELKLKSAVPLLTKNLQDRVPAVRRACARALGAVGDSTVIPELEKLAGDRDASVASAVREATQKINSRAVAPRPAKK